MSIFYYEPSYNWDRFFDEALASRGSRANSNGQQQRALAESSPDVPRFFKPKMDLHEDAEKNLVTASFEFPGLKKEDVQIELHNGRLTVAAESKISEEHEKDGYAVRERRFGKFSRTLQLPQGVNEEEVKASMEDGVLTLTFPKASAEVAPKKITIA